MTYKARMDIFTKQILDELLALMTNKQRLFVYEYIVDKNASAAYTRAGYTAQGDSIKANASRLLATANVNAAIQILIADQIDDTKITAQRVLDEMAKSAFANLGDYLEWTETRLKLKPQSSLTDEQMAAIAEISITPSKYGNTIKFKLNNKEKNLEMLARHMKLLTGEPLDDESDVEPVQVVINAVDASES